jgi:predicted GNAT superfamily acetyltransferase
MTLSIFETQKQASDAHEQAPATQPQRSLRIGALTDLDEFARCVELQLAVWKYDEADLIPKRVFLVAQKIGGQVFGAFDDSVTEEKDRIIAFAMGLPGYRNGRSYLHSHMLAVLPEYRNYGVGRRLKLAQRDDALARGIELMEWTFDPLEIKNAHLNIARLGAICRRYARNFYGSSSSPLQGGLPTDRLYAEWWLRSERVERILHPQGAATPTDASGESAAPSARVVVPRDIREWKEDPVRRDEALALQTRNREALEQAFAEGLAVTGYDRTPEGDGVFLLSPYTEDTDMSTTRP